ncbi:hypothetical protein SAMD00019534_109240 [Acytostelium subglobosum LB1]|uniref:hypothetical protein n=1 Tax=Acytostelium subglobosum LB1 TaxID=1410327 RepID=UPI0006448C7E|nr:hypothetical protein SAMD00019534_109240 [Acytostelium subglobosum LB1]GAM27748.1 hypothetical protein SAMD00019534_109240 [Acytostelium subglobosum LB1]|eukprot:XP_012749407.1 hypothetical protein SAMD00019534_109240 [Acytostelium subglobosum LB1]
MTKKRVYTRRSSALKKEEDAQEQQQHSGAVTDELVSLNKCAHVTKVEVICIDCKMLKKFNDTFDKRLDVLWVNMKSLLATYKTQDNAIKDIVEHYRQLHEALVIEEHMKKKDITLEMERTEETISRIAKEINDIHTLFNKVGDGHCETDTAELMRAATSSKTIAQFVKKIHINDGEPADNTDISLTAKFLECNEQMTTNQLQISRPFSIKTQQYTDTFTGEMQSIIDVIDSNTVWKSSHQYINHIFAFNDNGNKFIDPRIPSGRLYSLNEDKSKLIRSGVKTSTVYARDNIYVFGGVGHDQERSYVRYSLLEKTWCDNLSISGPSVVGGHGISVCFDGDKHIYLIGGCFKGINLNRIDCFNIETNTFRHIGSNRDCSKSGWTFFHNGALYTLGGIGQDSRLLHSCYMFDLKSLTSRVIFSVGVTKVVESCCFDGVDNIFLMCKDHSFLVMSLSQPKTKAIDLTPPDRSKSTTQPYILIYVPGTGPILLNNERVLQYLINDNKWKTINQSAQGYTNMCLITNA